MTRAHTRPFDPKTDPLNHVAAGEITAEKILVVAKELGARQAQQEVGRGFPPASTRHAQQLLDQMRQGYEGRLSETSVLGAIRGGREGFTRG